MNKLQGTSTGDDTEMIRATFRSVVQHGALLIGLICLCDSMMFYVIGDPQWWWGTVVGLSCIPAYRLMGQQQSFPVFISTLAMMIAVTGWYASHIALRFGGDINFHYKLIAIVPLIAVSGRMSVRRKWIWIVISTALLVALDHEVSMVRTTIDLHPTVATLMRAMNFGVPVLTVAALVLHYFKMVAEQQALLKEHATIDPLTGLMNRRRLREVWAIAEAEGRRGSFPLTIALCDIDRFKSINDTYGHDAGDEVLRQIGRLLPRELRLTDSVCRWGGEEFLLLLPHSDKAQALATSNRVREAIAATPLSVGPHTLNVTITMGIATLLGQEKFEAAAHRADLALYEGKRAGRNCVIVAADHYPDAASAA